MSTARGGGVWRSGDQHTIPGTLLARLESDPDNEYLDVNGTFDVAAGTQLLVHYGQERVRNFAAYSFRDARIALSKSFAGGWTVTGACTRGWGRTDAYDRYTTGALDSGGRPAISDPLRSTVLVSLARTF